MAGMMTCWLDEEWPAAELVPVHAELGAAVGRAYTRVRQREGVEEMGDLVLELAGELLPYDFAPTFTDAFSCANKVGAGSAVDWRNQLHALNHTARHAVPWLAGC